LNLSPSTCDQRVDTVGAHALSPAVAMLLVLLINNDQVALLSKIRLSFFSVAFADDDVFDVHAVGRALGAAEYPA